MASLYDISARYAAMLDAIDAAETGEEAYEMLDELTDIEDELSNKAENYAKIIKNVESDINGYKGEISRLTEKKHAAENLVKRLKQALLDAMKLTDTPEIVTSIGKWRVQDNPWSCEVMDINSVPSEYHIKQEDKIDKKGLLAHFKQTGELIDGVCFTQEKGIRFR